MSNTVGDDAPLAADPSGRDFDARPYSPDEMRVATWLSEKTGAGGGDDPIGFVIAALDYATAQRNILRAALGKVAALPNNGLAVTFARTALRHAGLPIPLTAEG